MESHQEELPTRGSDAILLCGGESVRPSVIKEAINDYVLVGSVPCKLSSEVHIDGLWVVGQHEEVSLWGGGGGVDYNL
jgi:hypothetical protein